MLNLKDIANIILETDKILDERNKYSSQQINQALQKQAKVYKILVENEKFAVAFYASEFFNLLSSKQQATLAAEQSEVMRKMIAEYKLANLQPSDLSMAVMSYALNISSLRKGLGIFLASCHAKNNASDHEREEICLAITQDKALVAKLNPAARILLYAFLKKSALFKQQATQGTLPAKLKNRIESAHDIRVDYNPKNMVWDKCLWPSLAGGFGIGDYMGRFSEFVLCAELQNPQYIEYPGDPQAAAELLITEPRFAKKLKNYYSEDGLRFELGMKYAHIARLLILYPQYRGDLTQQQIETLAQKHCLQETLKYQQLKLEMKKLKAQQVTVDPEPVNPETASNTITYQEPVSLAKTKGTLFYQASPLILSAAAATVCLLVNEIYNNSYRP